MLINKLPDFGWDRASTSDSAILLFHKTSLQNFLGNEGHGTVRIMMTLQVRFRLSNFNSIIQINHPIIPLLISDLFAIRWPIYPSFWAKARVCKPPTKNPHFFIIAISFCLDKVIGKSLSALIFILIT